MPSSIRFLRAAAALWLGIAGLAPAAARSLPAFVPTGAEMDAPRGFAEMCARQSSLCAPSSPSANPAAARPSEVDTTGAIGRDRADRARLGPATAGPKLNERAKDDLRLLKSVNRYVNGSVHQETDMQAFHREEFWQPSGVGPGAVGDCEDIALEKRIQLIKAGFSADRLALAVVYRHEIGLHTILIARTDGGDFILDSRNSFVELWDKPPYSWISVQSMTDEMVWRRVETSQG